MSDGRGAWERVAGLADNLISSVGGGRRRERRVVLYDAAGHARILPPETEGHEAVLEAADRLMALAEGGQGGGG